MTGCLFVPTFSIFRTTTISPVRTSLATPRALSAIAAGTAASGAATARAVFPVFTIAFLPSVDTFRLHASLAPVLTRPPGRAPEANPQGHQDEHGLVAIPVVEGLARKSLLG